LYYANIIRLLLFTESQDHVHTVRAFDTTKATPTVTVETVTVESTTVQSEVKPKQPTATKEL
jgi:hypothetical protein